MISLSKNYKRFDSSHIPVCDCYGNLHYESLNENKNVDTIGKTSDSKEVIPAKEELDILTREYKQKYIWCVKHRLLSTLIKDREYNYYHYKKVFDITNAFFKLHHKDIKIVNDFIYIFNKRYGKIYNLETKKGIT